MQDIKNPKIKWLAATDVEIDSLKRILGANETDSGKRAIGCKWTFKKKCNANGEIKRYKTKLVAKGHSQTLVSDYEIFALLVPHTTIIKLLNTAGY